MSLRAASVHVAVMLDGTKHYRQQDAPMRYDSVTWIRAFGGAVKHRDLALPARARAVSCVDHRTEARPAWTNQRRGTPSTDRDSFLDRDGRDGSSPRSDLVRREDDAVRRTVETRPGSRQDPSSRGRYRAPRYGSFHSIQGDEELKMQVLMTIAGAFGSALLAVQISLRQFRSTRSWERQLDAYTRVQVILHRLKLQVSRAFDVVNSMRHGGPASAADEQRLLGMESKLIEELQCAKAHAQLFCSRVVRDALAMLEKEWKRATANASPFDALQSKETAIARCIGIVGADIRNDPDRGFAPSPFAWVQRLTHRGQGAESSTPAMGTAE